MVQEVNSFGINGNGDRTLVHSKFCYKPSDGGGRARLEVGVELMKVRGKMEDH